MNFLHLIEEAKRDGKARITVAAAPFFEGTIFLLKRRFTEATHPGFFVFPSAEYKEGESVNQLLNKALVLDAGLTLDSIEGYLGHFDYDSTRQYTFLVKVKDPFSVQLSRHDAYAWAAVREAIGYPISNELREIIDRIIEKTSAS